LDEVHGEAFGGTRADARQAIEGGDEIEDRLRERVQMKAK